MNAAQAYTAADIQATREILRPQAIEAAGDEPPAEWIAHEIACMDVLAALERRCGADRLSDEIALEGLAERANVTDDVACAALMSLYERGSINYASVATTPPHLVLFGLMGGGPVDSDGMSF